MSRPRPHTAVHALWIVLALAPAATGGCAGFSFFGTGGIDYATTAQGNYEKALVQMQKKNWLDAIKLFQYTKSKFSFSKYATLSELGIAESEFGRDRYAAACPCLPRITDYTCI